MTYTTLVVIALICVSGFVAYFGDLLGRKMGKKRLTLFKMRPRYTAIVVTTITGMLISGFALATLVSVNPEFHRMFTQWERISKLNTQLLRSNQGLINQGAKLKAEIARQEKELAVALKDAKLAKKQRDLAQKSVGQLQRQIAVRQRELADLRARKDIAESELKQKRSELGLMQAQLDKEQEQLRLAQSQVAETEQQLGAAKARLKETQDELNRTGFLGSTAVDLALDLRYKDIAFRQGDELARGVIEPTLTDTELRHKIHELLDKASDKALEGGAKVGQNGRAVNLRRQKFSNTAEALAVSWNEATNVADTAGEIASAGTPMLIQVVCVTNDLHNEQVPVELRLTPNDVKIKKGQSIASTNVDGRQSEGSILLALNSFLQNDVAIAAVQAKVVPVAGQDPKTALGVNRQAQADELLSLVNKIKSLDATANVTVYATGDVHAGDVLNVSNIRFALEKE